MIQIREAGPDDVPALARVHVQGDWDTYAPLFGCRAYALEPTASELRWRRALNDGDTLLVASDGRRIVGLGHARGARIGALYLLRSHQRRGIGKALLSALLAALNKRGVAEARFDVVARNEDAIAFYLSCGAYRVGEAINKDRRGDTTDVVFAISTGKMIDAAMERLQVTAERPLRSAITVEIKNLLEDLSVRDGLLRVNNLSAQETSMLTRERFDRMISLARVATFIEPSAAFLVAFAEDDEFDGGHFLWFKSRFDKFLYIDRIVVAADRRRLGLGRLLYADLFKRAEELGHKSVACEVNLQPPNPISDRFHAAQGFEEVGGATIEDGAKTVRYLLRR
jgi:uncharacterized protein